MSEPVKAYCIKDPAGTLCLDSIHEREWGAWMWQFGPFGWGQKDIDNAIGRGWHAVKVEIKEVA